METPDPMIPPAREPLLHVPPLDARMDAASVTASEATAALFAWLTCATPPRLLSLTGAAGVGKTTAMLALAHTPAIRNRFKGGLIYLPLHPSRRNALPAALQSVFPTALRAPTQRLAALGFAAQLNKAHASASAGTALDTAPRYLLIADDLPSEQTLRLLRLILRDASCATLLFATRDASLAALASHACTLRPMAPQSARSFALFASWAGLPENHGISQNEEAVIGILTRCAGRPLLLGLAGRSAARTAGGGAPAWRTVLSKYHAKLRNAEKKASESCAHKRNPEVTIAAPVLRVCQELLVHELKDLNIDGLPVLLRRLCVLPRPAEVDASILAQLCGQIPPEHYRAFKDGLYDLGLLTDRSSNGGARYAVHDVVLDWLEGEARGAGEYVDAHRTFLRSFWTLPTGAPLHFANRDVTEPPSSTGGGAGATGAAASQTGLQAIDRASVDKVTRNWWSALLFHDSEFLSRHLSTLLVRAECLPELVGVLTRAEWTIAHASRNELNELRNDFDVCLHALGEDAAAEGHKAALTLVRNAVEDMWLSVRRYPAELRTQAAAMLTGLSDSWLVKRFIADTARPDCMWLRPRHRFVAQPAGPAHGSHVLDSMPDALGVAWSDAEVVATCDFGCALELDMCVRHAVPKWRPRFPNLPGQSHSCRHLSVVAMDDSTCYLLCIERGAWPMPNAQSVPEEAFCAQYALVLRAERRVLWENAVMLDPDVIVALGAGRIAVSTLGGGVSVSDMGSGHQVAQIVDCANQDFIPTAMALSRDTVVLGTSTGIVFLCDIQNAALRGVVEAHDLSVEAVATTGDGGVLLTGGSDGAVKWWDLDSGAPLHSAANAHPGGVRCLKIATSADVAVSGGADGAVRWWSATNGTPLGATCAGGSVVTHVAVRPDGGAVVTCGLDRVIRWWEGVGAAVRFDDSQWASPGDLGKRAFDNTVINLCISADGRSIFGLDSRGLLCMWEDGEKSWERENVWYMSLAAVGKTLLLGNWVRQVHEVINVDSKNIYELISKKSAVAPLIASDASLIVMMSENGSVNMYDIGGNLLLSVRSLTNRRPVTIAAGAICERAISADMDGKLTWWDLTVGEATLAEEVKEDRAECRGEEIEELQLENRDDVTWSVTCLAMSAGGGTAIVGSLGGWLQYWKWGGTKPMWQSHVHQGRVSSVSMSPNGKFAVTGGSDCMVVLWQLSPMLRAMVDVRRVHLPAAVTSIRLDASVRMFIVGDVKGGVWTFDLVGDNVAREEIVH